MNERDDSIVLSITKCYTDDEPPGKVTVEWDEEKDRRNRKKHGISLYSAAHVFSDSRRIEYYDQLHSQEEDRFITIGRVQKVIFVVYTYRSERIRIISARPASARERRMYYER